MNTTQVDKQILYQESAYQTRHSNIVHRGNDNWRYIDAVGDAVYVELRRLENDVILEKYVLVDGQTALDRKIVIEGRLTDAQLIRDAIKVFDALLDDHPMAHMNEDSEFPEYVGSDGNTHAEF